MVAMYAALVQGVFQDTICCACRSHPTVQAVYCTRVLFSAGSNPTRGQQLLSALPVGRGGPLSVSARVAATPTPVGGRSAIVDALVRLGL